MIGLDEVRKNREIINVIDWDMTSEEAVTLYLEWENSWSHGKNLVRSKNDVSHFSQREFEWDRFCYFVE